MHKKIYSWLLYELYSSAAVMLARTLVDTVQNDIVCANATQQQVEESLFMVMEMINQTQAEIDQVNHCQHQK